ncbi:hypothetical protein [Methanolobus sp. WCC5]|jgi:hypothetical protein|uniref:hypothetical protein n=1 Tax=Methanolobus sp. WCC5 TaxID=3125785 RepID=UPI0032523D3A
MEIEDLVLSTLAIGLLGSFFIYSMTDPFPSGFPLIQTFAIGGLWFYLFKDANFF